MMFLPNNIPLLSKHAWVAEILITLLVTLLVHYIEIKLYKRFYRKLKQTTKVWDDALLYSLHKPLGLLLWTFAIYIALYIATFSIKYTVALKFIDLIKNLGVIIALTWFLTGFIGHIEKALVKKSRQKQKSLDVTTVHALCQLFRIAVSVIALLIGLQMFGVPIAGIWAFGGFGGLAIGFAAKDLLANFFGGLMIFIDRPFSVGDWICTKDNNIEGTVEHIGWRLTKIRTFDKRELYVPNGLFSTLSIENPSRMTNRRIKAVINLRYDDAEKIPAILQDIENMLKQHPGIDKNQLLMVNLTECSAWSLDFMIYAFTVTTEWAEFLKVQQEVIIEALKIITTHQAETAFPTTTLNIPKTNSTSTPSI